MEARETDDIEGMPLLPSQVSLRIIGIKTSLILKKKKIKSELLRNLHFYLYGSNVLAEF